MPSTSHSATLPVCQFAQLPWPFFTTSTSTMSRGLAWRSELLCATWYTWRWVSIARECRRRSCRWPSVWKQLYLEPWCSHVFVCRLCASAAPPWGRPPPARLLTCFLMTSTSLTRYLNQIFKSFEPTIPPALKLQLSACLASSGSKPCSLSSAPCRRECVCVCLGRLCFDLSTWAFGFHFNGLLLWKLNRFRQNLNWETGS